MDYLKEIKNYLSKKGINSKIEAESKISSLGIDSLHYMEMIMHIEEEWNLVFSDQELLSISTIGDLINIIHTKK